MDHRVAIIGQSNSILQHGYVDHLKTHSRIELGNLGRLGASPSILVPFFGTRGFFAGHDFCIFDTAIVDQGFLWAGAVDPYSITHWISHGIIAARSVGCIPIVLVIPHKAAVPGPGAPLHLAFLQQLYRATALHNGAICLDLTDRLDALSREDSSLLDAAYADADHLSDSFSADVARQLVGAMDAVRRESAAAVNTVAVLSRFDRVPVAPTVPEARRKIHTSALMEGEFAILDDTRPTLEVEVGAVRRIHGLMINRATARGRIAIEGSELIVREVGTHRETDQAFVAQLVPLVSPLVDQRGSLRLSVATPEARPTEPTWNALPLDDPFIEVAEVLVEREAQMFAFEGPQVRPGLQQPAWIEP